MAFGRVAYSPDRMTAVIRAALVITLSAGLALSLAGGQPWASPLSDDNVRNTCRIAMSSYHSDRACGWTFDGITRIRDEADDPIDEFANLGRLGRIGFATSDLTIEETIAALSSGRAALLSWDREIGIADQLTASMDVAIETGSLSSRQFLLMPATFNEAYLSDFVDFAACATAHTFIFSGALDGRSDAPYVTHRWQEMKLDVCLDIAGADCSRAQRKIEPARLYFHSDWPCRYAPRRTSVDDGWSGI